MVGLSQGFEQFGIIIVLLDKLDLFGMAAMPLTLLLGDCILDSNFS